MSKGSKRKSAKYQSGVFSRLFKPVSQPIQAIQAAHLSMTDAEIDTNYFYFGKADKTRMKKEAAQYRLRLQIREILEKE